MFSRAKTKQNKIGDARRDSLTTTLQDSLSLERSTGRCNMFTWCKQGVGDGCGLLFRCGAVEARNYPPSLQLKCSRVFGCFVRWPPPAALLRPNRNKKSSGYNCNPFSLLFVKRFLLRRSLRSCVRRPLFTSPYTPALSKQLKRRLRKRGIGLDKERIWPEEHAVNRGNGQQIIGLSRAQWQRTRHLPAG